MTFGMKIKSEILRYENKHELCCKAELCGMICFGSKLVYSSKGKGIKFTTENAASARRCFSLIKHAFGISGGITCTKSRLVKGNNSYSVIVSENEAVKIFRGLDLYDDEFVERVVFKISPKIVAMHCCKKAFVRGAFIGSASVINPEKGYHLEFVTSRLQLTKDFCELLKEFDLSPKTVARKSSYVVYFKGSDEIGDILNIIGAHNAFMDLMNIKIIKETRNNVNRKVNCENANMDKTIDAAILQTEAIKRIQEKGAFDSLPKSLKKIAELRLRHTEMSLKDLGELMVPKISKSAVNHRFRKIMELDKKLEGKD